MGINPEDIIILAVDDEELVLEMLKDILESFHFKVEAYNNPILALRTFNRHPERYNLVISDVMMPKMSGVKMTSKMKDLNNSIPIVLTTGYSEKEEEALLEDSGVDAFIRKPFKHASLEEVIFDLLNIN